MAETEPKVETAKVEAKPSANEGSGHFLVLTELRLSMGRQFVTIRQNSVLNPQVDGHIIKHIEKVYAGTSLPIIELSNDELKQMRLSRGLRP